MAGGKKYQTETVSLMLCLSVPSATKDWTDNLNNLLKKQIVKTKKYCLKVILISTCWTRQGLLKHDNKKTKT